MTCNMWWVVNILSKLQLPSYNGLGLTVCWRFWTKGWLKSINWLINHVEQPWLHWVCNKTQVVRNRSGIHNKYTTLEATVLPLHMKTSDPLLVLFCTARYYPNSWQWRGLYCLDRVHCDLHPASAICRCQRKLWRQLYWHEPFAEAIAVVRIESTGTFTLPLYVMAWHMEDNMGKHREIAKRCPQYTSFVVLSKRRF